MRRMFSVLFIAATVVVGASNVLRAEDAKSAVQFPFIGAGGHVIEIGIAFDEAAVRAALPKGLEPAEGFTGGVDIYNVGYGWGVGAYSAGYVWLDLAGPPGPGGAPVRYIVRGYFSHLFYPFDVLVQGGSTLEESNGVFTGTAGPEGSVALRAVIKGDSSKCNLGASGMDDYVWGHESGSFMVTHIPAVGDVCEAAPIKVEIATDKDPALAGLTPKELLWAVSIMSGGAAAFPAPETWDR